MSTLILRTTFFLESHFWALEAACRSWALQPECRIPYAIHHLPYTPDHVLCSILGSTTYHLWDLLYTILGSTIYHVGIPNVSLVFGALLYLRVRPGKPAQSSLLPVGSYHTPFCGYLLSDLGSGNHKVGHSKRYGMSLQV